MKMFSYEDEGTKIEYSDGVLKVKTNRKDILNVLAKDFDKNTACRAACSGAEVKCSDSFAKLLLWYLAG